MAATVTETVESGFDPASGAVLSRRRRRLGALVLEDRTLEADPAETARVLAEAAVGPPRPQPRPAGPPPLAAPPLSRPADPAPCTPAPWLAVDGGNLALDAGGSITWPDVRTERTERTE